jgi:hypothetical protein
VNASEERLWIYRRILFRVGLYVLISPFALYFGPNLMMFGKLTRLSAADFVPYVERECVPTVRAIKEYQQDNCHLPDNVSDLVPKYLPVTPSATQSIENGQFRDWDNQQLNHEIHYNFIHGSEEWEVTGYFVNGPIPVPPVTIGPATLPAPPPG